MPWADGSSAFNGGVRRVRRAYLAQVTDWTPVSRLLGISWVAVGNIVERVVARRLDGARFDALKRASGDSRRTRPAASASRSSLPALATSSFSSLRLDQPSTSRTLLVRGRQRARSPLVKGLGQRLVLLGQARRLL